MTRRSSIDWDAQPLGVVRDIELARRLGVSRERVRQVRAARQIPRVPREASQHDWDAVPWGTMTDRQIAAELGVAPSTVFLERKKRNVPSAHARNKARMARLLTPERLQSMHHETQMSINEIAQSLGVSMATVRNYMHRHGIAIRSRTEAMRTPRVRRKLARAARNRYARKPEDP